MRLSLIGIPRAGAGKGGGNIIFERHHRVGMPDEPALSVKIGAGPVVRLTIEQQAQLEGFLGRPATPPTRSLAGRS